MPAFYFSFKDFFFKAENRRDGALGAHPCFYGKSSQRRLVPPAESKQRARAKGGGRGDGSEPGRTARETRKKEIRGSPFGFQHRAEACFLDFLYWTYWGDQG